MCIFSSYTWTARSIPTKNRLPSAILLQRIVGASLIAAHCLKNRREDEWHVGRVFFFLFLRAPILKPV